MVDSHAAHFKHLAQMRRQMSTWRYDMTGQKCAGS